MARLSFAVILALCLLKTTVQAANPVFGTYSTPSCDACLDQTYLSCPGDYQERSYGQCMCYGDGGTMTAQCLSVCDPGINEPFNVVATWYGYCVIFFKEMCAEAAEYISESRFNSECSEEAIAAGGVGQSGTGSSSGSEPSATVSATGNRASSNPTATTGTGGTRSSANSIATSTPTGSTGSSSGGSAAQATSGATAVPVPALAVIAGLGVQLIIDLNL